MFVAGEVFSVTINSFVAVKFKACKVCIKLYYIILQVSRFGNFLIPAYNNGITVGNRTGLCLGRME